MQRDTQRSLTFLRQISIDKPGDHIFQHSVIEALAKYMIKRDSQPFSRRHRPNEDDP